MAIFDKPTAFCNGLHRFNAQFFPFAKGRRFVIPALVNGLKQAVLLADNIVFQFTHYLKRKTRFLFQHLVRFPQNMFR